MKLLSIEPTSCSIQSIACRPFEARRQQTQIRLLPGALRRAAAARRQAQGRYLALQRPHGKPQRACALGWHENFGGAVD